MIQFETLNFFSSCFSTVQFKGTKYCSMRTSLLLLLVICSEVKPEDKSEDKLLTVLRSSTDNQIIRSNQNSECLENGKQVKIDGNCIYSPDDRNIFYLPAKLDQNIPIRRSCPRNYSRDRGNMCRKIVDMNKLKNNF